MGAWGSDGRSEPPKTLYTGKPDIVLALFNSPFGPDVLVTTDRLSEGVDLHRCCRHLIHYELDPSPVRTLQRNGRVRRVGSWAALTKAPICYAYPTFGGTRDEKAVGVMRQRINAFGLLLDEAEPLAERERSCLREQLFHRRRTGHALTNSMFCRGEESRVGRRDRDLVGRARRAPVLSSLTRRVGEGSGGRWKPGCHMQ